MCTCHGSVENVYVFAGFSSPAVRVLYCAITGKQKSCYSAQFHKTQSPPLSVLFFCSCDKIDHKQKVCFLLYLHGQIVT